MSGKISQVVGTHSADLEKAVLATVEAETHRLKAEIYDIQKNLDALQSNLDGQRQSLGSLTSAGDSDEVEHRCAMEKARGEGEEETRAITESLRVVTAEVVRLTAHRATAVSAKRSATHKQSSAIALDATVAGLLQQLASLTAQATQRALVEKTVKDLAAKVKGLEGFAAAGATVKAQLVASRALLASTTEALEARRAMIKSDSCMDADAVRAANKRLTAEITRLRGEAQARRAELLAIRGTVSTLESAVAMTGAALGSAKADNDALAAELAEAEANLKSREAWENVLTKDGMSNETVCQMKALRETVDRIVEAHPKTAAEVKKRGRAGTPVRK